MSKQIRVNVGTAIDKLCDVIKHADTDILEVVLADNIDFAEYAEYDVDTEEFVIDVTPGLEEAAKEWGELEERPTAEEHFEGFKQQRIPIPITTDTSPSEHADEEVEYGNISPPGIELQHYEDATAYADMGSGI